MKMLNEIICIWHERKRESDKISMQWENVIWDLKNLILILYTKYINKKISYINKTNNLLPQN